VLECRYGLWQVEQGHVSQTAGDVEGLEQQHQAERETLALVRSLLEAGVGQGAVCLVEFCNQSIVSVQTAFCKMY
jgi:hypothetical protein